MKPKELNLSTKYRCWRKVVLKQWTIWISIEFVKRVYSKLKIKFSNKRVYIRASRVCNIFKLYTLGEMNHLVHKVESQSRDLSKALKESAIVLQEYDKALIRKSYECSVSSFEVLVLSC